MFLFRILFFTCFLATVAQSQEKPATFEFFPEQKLFPQLPADALSHHISVSRLIRNRDWIGTIGASVAIMQLDLEDISLQFSPAVSTFNRLIKPPGITVYTIDYKMDFMLDTRCENWTIRTGLGHYSCHFADDGIEILGRSSIQSVRDYIVLGASYELPVIGGFVYGLGIYNYHIKPIENKHWNIQVGSEFGNIRLADFAHLYGAIDLKLKEEVAWGSTQSYQVGVRFFAARSNALRVAYTLRRGFDERGQFFNIREKADLLSLHFDL
ncbi:MAG: DUF1207 domain-containing protein [Bacteroidota bacterium]